MRKHPREKPDTTTLQDYFSSEAVMNEEEGRVIGTYRKNSGNLPMQPANNPATDVLPAKNLKSG